MKDVKHVAYLDGLRGAAIAGVVLVHVSQIMPGLSAPLQNISVYGAKGVQLFFVVSGFTLGLNYIDRPLNLATFYIRRIFRIAPMFYLGALLYGVLGWLTAARFSGAGETPAAVLATLSFLHGWHPDTINKVVPGGWSIAAEMMFYAIFPALHLLFRNRNARTKAGLCGIVAGAFAFGLASFLLAERVAGTGQGEAASFAYFFWATQLPAFVSGLAASQAAKWIQPVAGRALCYGSVAAIAVVAVFKSPLSNFFVADLLFAGLTLGASAARPTVLESRTMSFVGLVSFSIYILHFAVVNVADAMLPATFRTGDAALIGVYAVVLATTTFLSWLTFKWVETPFINLAKRLKGPRTLGGSGAGSENVPAREGRR